MKEIIMAFKNIYFYLSGGVNKIIKKPAGAAVQKK